ncbi:hypothetical protein [Nocardiopsis valliformis]|uniref:hypothetical protein n=1 Tax=Nocardiopsis valliformis TaxID=239974 RepID=UPI00034A82FE|nr:hypothetical protein [Nocardiopsis valliformis]
MKDDIPLVYWTFRGVWTAVHVALVACAAWALFAWGLTDGNAERAVSGFLGGLFEFQRTVAGIVPWPWGM